MSEHVTQECLDVNCFLNCQLHVARKAGLRSWFTLTDSREEKEPTLWLNLVCAILQALETVQVTTLGIFHFIHWKGAGGG